MIRALRNTHEPRVQDASALNLCLMPETSVRPAEGARRSFQLGIGGRLFLGLTAVAGVILVGHTIATETTRRAVTAVREMQHTNEPLARRAGTIVEKLVAYDRAVSEYVQGAHEPAESSIDRARVQLEQSLDAYFKGDPKPALTPSVSELQLSVASHIARGRSLAAEAVQRADWVIHRNQALAGVQERVVAAGGTGVRINDNQVFARRSLSELAAAATALRSGTGGATSGPREEKEFAAVLANHSAEFMKSPGKAWLDLLREDFSNAVRLRALIEKFDATNGPSRREFLDEGTALVAGAQQDLQAPARRALLAAAENAASSAEEAERVLGRTGLAVLGVVVMVSIVLMVSITRPARRLTQATRLLASGNRTARAPRGGAAEIDALAESINAMADQVVAAETELRAHQAELEKHVAERTRQLHHLAHHDPLTQLPNRRQLSARLGGALSRASSTGQQLALLFVDLDNFKSINDTLGHNFGDRVLQVVAERLSSAAGPRSVLARLGGDEFTVLIEDVRSHEEVLERANDIVAALQQPLSIKGRVLSTSASVGASLYPEHAADADALLRAADVALFRAKELGRNRCALYAPSLYDAAAQRFRLEQSLRRAVEAGDLMLMYQPQIALHTFEPVGMEALLRWRKPDGRVATATEFIHIAEKTGMMYELTEWVLRAATSAVAAWRAQGWSRASVAINVSPQQLFEGGFVDHVKQALDVTGLPANALELELTESVFQTGASTIVALGRLRNMGVSIALDDFGIGYSSLTSLEQLPITRVKLDRMLVESVDTNPRSAAIARSIIALCHGLGLQVIAEGVERGPQLEFLSKCGPVGVQGYLLAHAVEADAAPGEAAAAAERARGLLEEAAQRGESDGPEQGSLVFVGSSPRWMRS
jgi:diguanylate cyclase (GGDEF)-like protein